MNDSGWHHLAGWFYLLGCYKLFCDRCSLPNMNIQCEVLYSCPSHMSTHKLLSQKSSWSSILSLFLSLTSQPSHLPLTTNLYLFLPLLTIFLYNIGNYIYQLQALSVRKISTYRYLLWLFYFFNLNFIFHSQLTFTVILYQFEGQTQQSETHRTTPEWSFSETVFHCQLTSTYGTNLPIN